MSNQPKKEEGEYVTHPWSGTPYGGILSSVLSLTKATIKIGGFEAMLNSVFSEFPKRDSESPEEAAKSGKRFVQRLQVMSYIHGMLSELFNTAYAIGTRFKVLDNVREAELHLSVLRTRFKDEKPEVGESTTLVHLNMIAEYLKNIRTGLEASIPFNIEHRRSTDVLNELRKILFHNGELLPMEFWPKVDQGDINDPTTGGGAAPSTPTPPPSQPPPSPAGNRMEGVFEFRQMLETMIAQWGVRSPKIGEV